MPRDYDKSPSHIKITIDVSVYDSVVENKLRKKFAEFVNSNGDRFFEPIVDAIGTDCALSNVSLEVIEHDKIEDDN